MKHLINWTSQNEINEQLDMAAKINRLKMHNLLLEIVIACCVGVSIVLGTVLAALIWG